MRLAARRPLAFCTAMKHLKDIIQKIVDKLINLDDGEVWPLKSVAQRRGHDAAARVAP